MSLDFLDPNKKPDLVYTEAPHMDSLVFAPLDVALRVDQLHEAQSQSLDISKAFHRLNWQPKWSVKDSIQKTAIWYKSYHQKEDVLSLSICQIQEYFSN